MLKTRFIDLTDYWVYPLYILVACAFTAGLNIVHSKYILGIELNTSLFIVPMIAGVTFGYLTARIRLIKLHRNDIGTFVIYTKYILLSCVVTSSLNIIHTEWVLSSSLSAEMFIAPLFAGVFFGYLLARIKTINNKLLKLATTDMLTQLCNRMHFDHILSQEIEKVKRYGGTFSIIYFDIDNFKDINDKHGHTVGDQTLTALANHINNIKRRTDVFARYGGDEFIILAPSTTLSAAQRQAELIKQAIEKLQLDGIQKLSCSFGVTEFNNATTSHIILMNIVDKALYAAKNSGRDTVVAT